MNNKVENHYPDLEHLGLAERYSDEIFEIMDSIELFEGFALEEVEELCHYMYCYGAPRGVRLLAEGADGDFLILILTGEVKVTKQFPDGKQAFIASLMPGKMLGEMSMLDGEPRFASCDTVEPTDFAVLSRQSLNDLLAHKPRLANKLLLSLLQLMTVRLRDTSNRMLPFLASTAI